MGDMFEGCSSLTSLAIGSGFTVGSGTTTTDMFSGCTNLATGTLKVIGTTAPNIQKDIFSGVYTEGTLNTDKALTISSPWKGGVFTTVKRMTAYAVLTGGGSNKTLTFKYEVHEVDPNSTTEWDVTNTGTFIPGWSSERGNITQVVFEKSFADARPKTCYSWFGDFRNLTTITGIENLNTSEVKNMNGMFNGCSSLTSLDVSHFNTSQVKDMGFMFYDCSSLQTLNLSSFDTGNVTDMGYMFYCCGSLTSLDVSHFYTSQVTDMSSMFWGCCDLTSLDVSSFNTSNVEDMGSMFMNCSNLTSLSIGSGFEVKSNTTITNMFNYCNNLVSGTLYVKGTTAPSIEQNIFGVFTNGTLITDMTAETLGATVSGVKYTWKGGTFNKPTKLANNLGANVTVTFYDGGAAKPTGFDVTAPGTPVTSADAGQWIVMHIVPADGYWTDAQLLMAMEKAAAPARAKAPGFELGRIPTLLKRDTYTDAEGTHDRQDGAGWYYYQIPADHTYAAGYTQSAIEGYVVPKFDLSTDNTANISQSGTVVTVTHGTADNWTAEVSFNAVEFPFTGEAIGPEITGVTIKKGSTTILEMTAVETALHLLAPAKNGLRIVDGEEIRTNAVSNYTCFRRSDYGDDGLVPNATYSIIVPFEGSGTADDPWKIKTAADLVLLGKCVNVGGFEFPGKYLAQTDNIDMSGTTGFEPIGIIDPTDGKNAFAGSYDGQGKTVSGINYTNSTAPSYDGAYSCIGLFGEVSTTGTIQDVTLIDCTFSGTATSSVAYAGGIAGYLKQGTISGCTVKATSSVSALKAGSATGAIVGQRGDAGTLSKNYYTYDVSVSNSSGTATGYAKRGYWKATAWDDVNDATEGAMLLVKKATLPAANANGSTVTFNEVTPGTDCYAIDGANYYYAPGQIITLSVTTGKRTETTDIRTFYDELSTLTMNDGTTDTDIKEKRAFTMPETDATIAATFSTSTWFTIDTNQKEWMSFYHEWENTAAVNYTVTDGSGTGKTIGVKTITGVDLQTGVVTAADLDGVSYNGVPTLFSCESGLPEKLKFTPNTTATNSVTPYSSFKGTAKALTAAELDALGNGLYVMNGLGEFIRAYDHTGGLAAHRCYINLGSVAAPSRLKIKDETLGISPVDIDFSDDAWYSLDGRKLDGKPMKKGLYINGGRKVVIK